MNFGLNYGSPETVAELSACWTPSQEVIDAELASYSGSWTEQMTARTVESLYMHTIGIFAWALCRAGGLMLIGMALYKWCVLTGQRDTRFYRRLAFIGLGTGLPIVILATFIFYGFGLSLFGGVELAVSPWWLTQLRFGPLEWLWRSLTYMSWQPMRGRTPQEVLT